MRVLIVGSGGREHTIADTFFRSKQVSKVYITPGNCGMIDVAEQIITADHQEIYNSVTDKKIDLVVVGPELPLKEGLSDFLTRRGVRVVGPSKRGAQLETSKVFAKDFMHRYNIPTPDYRVFSRFEDASSFINHYQDKFPIVVKADGLAGGKGVVIAGSKEEALSALNSIMKVKRFGGAGNQVVLEEFLQGCEASVFAFTDGKDYVMTILSRDYKKVFDNDKGPNTGGMGAFAPVSADYDVYTNIKETVFDPLLKGLQAESIEYKGIIYAGLMFTETGIQVLEFNCRLGDPETQAVLPLLETDFAEICEAIVTNRVSKLNLKWSHQSAVSIVASSKGYPEKYDVNKAIDINYPFDDSIRLYFSNVTRNNDNVLLTSGGRVLSLTAIAPTLPEARCKAYENIERIKFDNMFYRSDIALTKELLP